MVNESELVPEARLGAMCSGSPHCLMLITCQIKDYLAPHHGENRLSFELPAIEGGIFALGLKGVGINCEFLFQVYDCQVSRVAGLQTDMGEIENSGGVD